MAITGFVLLMVVGNAILLKRNQSRILEHQQALLAISTEADMIRAHHRSDLVAGTQIPFFTMADLPASLTYPNGIVRVVEDSQSGCLGVHLRLSWGSQERAREEVFFVLCP